MSVQRESQHEFYDVIVIGSGMGGLSAAALLALAGKKVLVVERHDRPGGYAHGFQRKRYKFDAAVHMTSGCEPAGFGDGAFMHELLELLGVRDRVTFLPLNPFYHAVYPDLRFAAPTGTQEFIEAHARLFPREEQGLRQFMRLCIRMNRENKKLPVDLGSFDDLTDPAGFPLHRQYRHATLDAVMSEFIGDPKLRALLGSLWDFQGLPPSMVSFIKWTPMLMSFVHTGAYYCEGGFQNLVNAFVAGFERHGGELLLRTSVRRILLKNGRAAGIMLENGQRIHAPVVISNADATQTFEELVGPEHLPAEFMGRLRRMRPSLSAVASYLATDLDLRQVEGLGHEMFVFPSWDHDATYRDMLAGQPASVLVTVPTLVDPSLAPKGEHIVSIVSLLPYDVATSWRGEKEEYQERVLRRVETVIPGLRDHLTFTEGGTPRTMERFTLNHLGAIYGWEQSPAQAGPDRLGRETPVPGLHLAGHWTQPGGGVLSVCVSGAQTAQLVLGYPHVNKLLMDLGLSTREPVSA